jgi:hypothetical protein
MTIDQWFLSPHCYLHSEGGRRKIVAGEDRVGCAKMSSCRGERYEAIDSGKVRVSMRSSSFLVRGCVIAAHRRAPQSTSRVRCEYMMSAWVSEIS